MAITKSMHSAAVQYVYDRNIKGNSTREESFANEVRNAKIARALYDLRKQAGLTQRQVAKLVGTTASVIRRLEDADDEGHALLMLQRITAVLNKKAEMPCC
jgi:DNA-binding XRE family transcriptional regulator